MGANQQNLQNRRKHTPKLSSIANVPGVHVCVQVDLGLSPVTQVKLVEVLEVLIQTGTRAIEGASKGRNGQRGSSSAARFRGSQGSMYWGNRRGYAGAIMDSGELRRSLPRQLMSLYTSVQAIEGLGAEDFLSYFKFGWVCGCVYTRPPTSGAFAACTGANTRSTPSREYK